jgi:S1-C subfamily serine protease
MTDLRLLCCLTLGGTLAASEAFRRHRLSRARPFSKCSPAVVTVTTPESFGSGVVVRADGIVATNLHVVRGQRTISVPEIAKTLGVDAIVEGSVVRGAAGFAFLRS